MVPLVNKIGTQCACIGNHELDFGVEQFRHLASKCDFPWLLANVLDPALGENVPLANAKRTHMITASNGIKIGLLGLGEREWLECINVLPPNLIYKSATETAKELIPKLRAQGADIIIALTHQREHNDLKLATQMNGEIDLILGGHDHFYGHTLINGTHVLRSGTDFKNLSYLEARRSTNQPGKWDIDIWRRDIVSAVPEDKDTLTLVDKLTSKLKKKLAQPIGYTASPLDARFSTARTQESNIGNLVCDIMRYHYEADCALMAGGTIRGDMIYPPGPITMRDITNCFPFEDPLIVIRASGKKLLAALENGVSLYPALEGRFPQVSNIVFSFDPSREPGHRVVESQIGGEPLDLNREYTIVTRGYMGRGKDGYDAFLVKSEGGECEELVSEETGMLVSLLLQQYFLSLRVMGNWRHWGPSMDRHWGHVVSEVSTSHPSLVPGKPQTLSSTVEESDAGKRKSGWDDFTPNKIRRRRSSLASADGPLDGSDSDGDGDDNVVNEIEQDEKELTIMRRVFRKWCRLAKVSTKPCDDLKETEWEFRWTKPVVARVEGRIKIIGAEST